MNSKYRYLVPNGITFISLACGLIAIFMAASGLYKASGIFIMASYVLDLFDGASARYLKAGTEFGLQLDSLVDMVSLGTAPAVLAFMYMRALGLPPLLVWPVSILFPLAGAFRLARFNLLPAKTTGKHDSIGLTITAGGATVALSVLADLAPPIRFLPELGAFWFIPMMIGVSSLMVSRIPFPSFAGVFSSKRNNALLLILFGASLLLTSLFNVLFLWNNTYLGVSIARASYKSLK